MIIQLYCAYLHVPDCWTRGGLTPLIADNPLQKKTARIVQIKQKWYYTGYISISVLVYSGTLLIQSPMGHKNLAILTGWPYQKGTLLRPE